MPSITETIERLSAMRRGSAPAAGTASVDRLSDITDFGDNPGALRARTYVPAGIAPGAALVVVLHGCTQTAAGYDHGSGWSRLADRHGFAVLAPEQTRANNPNLCFNWFAPDDIRRDGGEAGSIRQMIAAMVDRHAIAADRIFVTGLSAGGAMTAVMLATYPDVFAGGAVIAGLPFGTATSVQQALTRMRGQGLPDDMAAAALVRRASTHGSAWPTLSVWHGDADATVSAANADALLGQWRALHEVGPAPTTVYDGSRFCQRVWRDVAGRDVIEDYRIAGMGHGTPLDPAGGCGASGPYMLDVGLPSTRLIAERWGIAQPARLDRAAPARPAAVPSPANDPLPLAMPLQLPAGVERTINDALRKAGLLR